MKHFGRPPHRLAARCLAAMAPALLCVAPIAGADTDAVAGLPSFERCSPDTAERLRFIEGGLERDEFYADAWYWSWMGVYTAGILFEGIQAGLENSRGEQAEHSVSAGKAVVGLVRGLWAPPPGRDGNAALQGLDVGSEAACAERLDRAEAVLRHNAKDSHRNRWNWIPHAANLGLNLAGALIVAEAFDESPDGWIDGAVGFAVGELRIWSYPWQAGGRLAEYEQRFPPIGAYEPSPRFSVGPWGAGARLLVQF